VAPFPLAAVNAGRGSHGRNYNRHEKPTMAMHKAILLQTKEITSPNGSAMR
jgi:hypothetical protein